MISPTRSIGLLLLSRHTYRLVRWGVGAVFLIAGTIKLQDPSGFALLISDFGLIPEALAMPVAIGLQRAGNRSTPDRFEQETYGFFDRVRAQYLRIARDEPRRVKILDATPELATVQAHIRRVLEEFIRGS